jgi:hypothetical protein
MLLGGGEARLLLSGDACFRAKEGPASACRQLASISSLCNSCTTQLLGFPLDLLICLELSLITIIGSYPLIEGGNNWNLMSLYRIGCFPIRVLGWGACSQQDLEGAKTVHGVARRQTPRCHGPSDHFEEYLQVSPRQKGQPVPLRGRLDRTKALNSVIHCCKISI